MTTTPTSPPEAEALPTLPVVAWHFECMKPGKCETFASVFEDDSTHWPIDQWKKVTKSALTPQAPAEAAIVALRAERDEWRTRAVEAQISLEDYKSSFWKAAELRDALRTALEIIGIGDSSNPKVDAADALVELGLWRREAVDEMRAARASLLGDGGTL